MNLENKLKTETCDNIRGENKFCKYSHNIDLICKYRQDNGECFKNYGNSKIQIYFRTNNTTGGKK